MYYAEIDAPAEYVSLCKREWIEISIRIPLTVYVRVSLCKREWIEISDIAANQQSGMSPSARGSGLK